PLEIPPRTALGDIASPVAFELAKRLKASTGRKHNPREIAARLSERLSDLKGITRAEIAGAGYINVYLDRANYLLHSIEGPEPMRSLLGGKIIVEHTAVNPNKAAHIGHLRNAVLGDTTIRMLRFAGEEVEAQNYIDNTGVQVADVVVGFKHIEQKSLDEVKAISERFDYYCWDLYARVGSFYEEDSSRKALRVETLHEIEAGKGETYEMADYISTRILACHLDTFLRVGVLYDVLPRESDVLHLHIWERAFALLKQRGAVVYETAGKLAGCWVMRAAVSTPVEGIKIPFSSVPSTVKERDAHDADAESEHEADKVIVRSNGTVTYTGKDIAFHLWKLGQLGIDFYYKPFRTYPDGHVCWITTSDENENDPSHPEFGNGAAYFNVIDIGQSYPQHYVKLGVTAVDHDERVERSAHLAYEKVVLTPAAAQQLGQTLSEEDRARGAVGMSGRKGLGVKADDLIDQLEANALVEVEKRHPDLSEEDRLAAAHKIAVGALRYFLLKYTRTSIISFDFKEALAFEGETGPYIQYSVVRTHSIFRKLAEAGMTESDLDVRRFSREEIARHLDSEQGDELWSLAYTATQLANVVRGATAALEPAVVAKWAFQLAQRFNLFYHHHHILTESDPARRALLVAITSIVQRQLTEALAILGISAPERM
ncbi:MAG: arginine--tRNA ligase, partial [Blastocatellia bacterium]|nr:arginine--tRNA ligase [Blastocatellia bacterium]